MTELRFVIFDMDEVLYDYDHQVRLALLEDLTERPAAEINQALWGGPHEEAAEAGDPDTAEAYLAQYADLLGYPIDFETWADIRRRMMRPRADVLALVRQLSVRTDVALLTNNGMMLKAALGVCAPDAVEIFGDKAHVSAEFGARKPDPRVYQRLCRKYGYDPAQSAFVDDRLENVEGARRAGLMGHLYQDVSRLQTFFQERKLI